jgi:hypothetical protein
MIKSFLSLFLSGLLWINPIVVMAQTNNEEKLNQLYMETRDITYKKTLEIGLQEATTDKERNEFKKGLAVLEKNPALGSVSVGESIDSMAYFFLNNLEKDFIAFPKSYEFYKGFRSVFRGQKFNQYNAKCVYNRSNTVPFNMADFINGKFPCSAPKNYPRGVSKYKIIEGIEKGLKDLDKKVTINYFETGKSIGQFIMGFLISDAYAIKPGMKGLASTLLIAGGVIIIVLGIAVTPIAAIGIPVIALGCGAIVAGIGMGGWALSDKIKKKRDRPQ